VRSPPELVEGQPFRRLAQARLEAANAQTRERGFDPVANARALPDQTFALAARPLGVLFCQAGDRSHAAVAAFPSQPAEKGPLQQRGVEPIGLRPAMFARDGDAAGMDHMRFDRMHAQPAGQPEAVAAGLVGNHNPGDRTAGLAGLLTPAMQQLQQRRRVRFQLLQRTPRDPGNNASHQPARLAHLDYRDQRAILVESGERPAQVIDLWHGAPRRFCAATMMPFSRRSPHSISEVPREARPRRTQKGDPSETGAPPLRH
jgi:hypothetical protein